MNRRRFIGFLIAAPLSKSLPWNAIANGLEKIAPGISNDIRLSFSEIVAETLRRHRHEIAANILASNALLKRGLRSLNERPNA